MFYEKNDFMLDMVFDLDVTYLLDLYESSRESHEWSEVLYRAKCYTII